MLRTAMTGLRTLERHVIALLLIAMSAGYVVNVLVRVFAPSQSLHFAWMEEATLFMLAWLVFLGLGLTLEKGRHIAMTALYGRLPAGVQRLLAFVINVVGLVFSAYLVKVGFDFALFIANSGQTSPTLDISMVWLYAALPVGFVLIGLRYLLELVGAENRFVLADRGQDH